MYHVMLSFIVSSYPYLVAFYYYPSSSKSGSRWRSLWYYCCIYTYYVDYVTDMGGASAASVTLARFPRSSVAPSNVHSNSGPKGRKTLGHRPDCSIGILLGLPRGWAPWRGRPTIGLIGLTLGFVVLPMLQSDLWQASDHTHTHTHTHTHRHTQLIY